MRESWERKNSIATIIISSRKSNNHRCQGHSFVTIKLITYVENVSTGEVRQTYLIMYGEMRQKAFFCVKCSEYCYKESLKTAVIVCIGQNSICPFVQANQKTQIYLCPAKKKDLRVLIEKSDPFSIQMMAWRTDFV